MNQPLRQHADRVISASIRAVLPGEAAVDAPVAAGLTGANVNDVAALMGG